MTSTNSHLGRHGQALDEPSVRLGEVVLRERDRGEGEAHVRDAVAVAASPLRLEDGHGGRPCALEVPDLLV